MVTTESRYFFERFQLLERGAARSARKLKSASGPNSNWM